MEWNAHAIRHAREARGWSQARLAQALSDAQPDGSVSKRSVSAWETGEAVPSGRNLNALDRVLGAGHDSIQPAAEIDPSLMETYLDRASPAELLAALARLFSRLGPPIALPEILERPRVWPREDDSTGTQHGTTG